MTNDEFDEFLGLPSEYFHIEIDPRRDCQRRINVAKLALMRGDNVRIIQFSNRFGGHGLPLAGEARKQYDYSRVIREGTGDDYGQ